MATTVGQRNMGAFLAFCEAAGLGSRKATRDEYGALVEIPISLGGGRPMESVVASIWMLDDGTMRLSTAGLGDEPVDRRDLARVADVLNWANSSMRWASFWIGDDGMVHASSDTIVSDAHAGADAMRTLRSVVAACIDVMGVVKDVLAHRDDSSPEGDDGAE